MMKLIDTCGWIEWLTNGALCDSFQPYFSDLDQLIVPTLIQYELYKWICREKDPAVALEIIGITEQAQVMPLDTSMALYAAELSKSHHLAMADAIIYASCLKNNATLITADKHFQALPHVVYFKKSGC